MVGERDDALVDHLADALGREGLVVDVVEHSGVELLHADGEPGAVGLVLLPCRAGVVVADVPGMPSAGDRDAAAAGAAPEPRREHAAFAHVDGMVAVAALLLVAILQLPQGSDAGEVLVGDGCVVAIARERVALLHEVSAIRHVRQDVLNVLGAPRPREPIARDLTTRRSDTLAGKLFGEPLLTVFAHEVLAEDALDRLEVGPGLVGDGEARPAVDLLERVAVGRVPVLPEALRGLRLHSTLHIVGKLLRVPLGEPREDRPDQLAEGLVSGVGLGEGDHVDVGLVERGQRLQAVEHIAGYTRESPDVKPVNALHAHRPPTEAGVPLALCRAKERLVCGALLGVAPADPLVNKPVGGGVDHAVGSGPAFDLLFLLLDRLVLPGVAAPQIRGSDHGHGGLQSAGYT